MRLARPVYETLPLTYMTIGGVGLLIAYLDPSGVRATVATAIGLLAEIAALTIYLHRKDYRALKQEYSGETIELPSSLNW
jgi:biopolymer transport protein ExbB/TolQ